MSKLDITINLKGKKKATEAAKSPEVWPTMIQSDDPFLAPTTFEFFDALTTPVDLVATGLTTQSLSVSGNYEDLVAWQAPTRVEYEEYNETTAEWDTKHAIVLTSYPEFTSENLTIIHFEEDLPAAAEHIKGVRLWRDCAGLSGDLVNVNSTTADFDTSLTWLLKGRASEVTIDCYTNESSLIPQTTIESEFSTTDMVKLLDRKPLGKIQDDGAYAGRDDNDRWFLGAGFYDILMHLKRAADSTDDNHRLTCSPDLIHESETSWRPKATTEGLNFKSSSLLGSFDIAVTELGSGTMGHYWYPYVYSHEGGNIVFHSKYRNDLLHTNVRINGTDTSVPAGIFYSPFDTADKTVFKVTTAPQYTAEEYMGHVVSSGKKHQVLLKARTVAYYNRSRDTVASGSDVAAYTGSFPNGCDYCDPMPTCPEQWACAGFFHGAVAAVQGQGSPFSTSLDLSATSSGCCTPGACTPEELCFDCIATETWEVNYTIIENHHKFGLWYDRLPNNFQRVFLETFYSGNASRDVELQLSDVVWGSYPYRAYYVSDLSKNHLAVSWAEAPCGLNNLHLLSTAGYIRSDPTLTNAKASMVGAYSVEVTSWNTQQGLKIGRTWPSDLIPMASRFIEQKIMGVPATHGSKIPTVRSSAFWTNHNLPSFDAGHNYSKWDNIPCGTALVPDKAGALVGIIVQGSRVFYVWRREDEEFTMDNIPLDPVPLGYEEYDGHIQSFESINDGGGVHPWENLDTGGPTSESISTLGGSCADIQEFELIDQFSNEDGVGAIKLRKLTHFGRGVSYVATGEHFIRNDAPGNDTPVTCTNALLDYYAPEASTRGQFELPAPVYVMTSHEAILRPGSVYSEDWYAPCRRVQRNNYGYVSPPVCLR
jgi:hypothetical protein